MVLTRAASASINNKPPSRSYAGFSLSLQEFSHKYKIILMSDHLYVIPAFIMSSNTYFQIINGSVFNKCSDARNDYFDSTSKQMNNILHIFSSSVKLLHMHLNFAAYLFYLFLNGDCKQILLHIFDFAIYQFLIGWSTILCLPPY